MLTQKEADKLMKIKGESRGVNIKIDLDYFLEQAGEKTLKRLENKIAELGYPLKRKNIQLMDFYPIGLETIIIICIKDILHLDENGLEKMGESVVKFSIFIKILMKYFGSLEMIAKEIPNTWKEHYTIGSLKMEEFDDNHAVLIQENFKIHPVYCFIHKGYFKKVAQMVQKTEINSEETKCVFKGNKYSEFLLTWR